MLKTQTNFRKAQYNNAYGNYKGGYRGGFGFRRGPPPPLMALPGPPFGFFGPFGPYRPPGPPFRPGPMNTYGRNMYGAPMEEKTIRFLMSEYVYLTEGYYHWMAIINTQEYSFISALLNVSL